ncbi:MAG: chorismate--pyruvate lyase [Clostridia bacterium]|nr:chorismate--pyruvate lyase [Clostridia bacterium]
MEPKEYIVEKIDGDYAWLRRVGAPEEEPVPVARALLPEETDEGSRLLYQMLTYTLLP